MGLSFVFTYASLVSYIATAFAWGESSVPARVCGVAFIIAVLTIYFLSRVRMMTGRGERLWDIYRSPQTERWQVRLAISLWVFIGIGVLMLVYYRGSKIP